MSDQPPLKPPTNTNASKRFAIPTRPAKTGSRELEALAPKTMEADQEQKQEDEALETLIDPRRRPASSTNPQQKSARTAPAAQATPALKASPASQLKPGIDSLATQVTPAPKSQPAAKSHLDIDSFATQITPAPKSLSGIEALETQITPKSKLGLETPSSQLGQAAVPLTDRTEISLEEEPSVYNASTLLLPAARLPQTPQRVSPTPPPGTLMPPSGPISRSPQGPTPTPPPGTLGPIPTPPPGALGPAPTSRPGPGIQVAQRPQGPTPTPLPGTLMLTPTPPPGALITPSGVGHQVVERELVPAPPAPERPARSRLLRVLPMAIIILLLIIIIAALLGGQLLSSLRGSDIQGNPPVYSSDGPYAQLPLDAQQINNIQHLAGHMKYKALASLYVSHMSLDDEIGQLIMVEYNQTSYSSDLDYMINTLHVGGVIMYEFQMNTASQTKSDITHMQERANIPLLISTDEEGGPYVHRLSNIYGYRMSATQIGDSGSLDVAKQQGLKTSKDLAALGINEDLAPDVDVNQVNGYDMVTRTFGNTANQVIQFAGAYLQAMQGNGTIACIKHFPGLGGALTDAHTGLPVVHSTKQQIYTTDLAPFKAFIQSPDALLNPGMIMPTDVLMPAIDAKYPAELSHTFMTDILRDQLGYDGVVLTDALYMQGITDTWDMYTASVMALQAGDDMLLGANGTQQTLGVINAIKQALQDGQLTKARIDESAARIIALKMQYHLMPTYIPEV